MTEREERYCDEIAERVARIREFLTSNSLSVPPDVSQWHAFIAELRLIQGNISNDGSFLATLLAKAYLGRRHGASFDAAQEPQGAPGIDIDTRAATGEWIVAEIKTTVPYKETDFGAQQAASFTKDFTKLAAADAEHKYILVTDSRAFSALKQAKYRHLIAGVSVVNLVTGEEYAA